MRPVARAAALGLVGLGVVLGHKSPNAVSSIDVGIEGLPAKRAYAWARKLLAKYRRRLRDQADEFATPARAAERR